MKKIRINYSHEGALAQITLNAPKGNVLDKEMTTEMQAAFQDFKNRQGLKLITFEGAGEHFSFGASVEEHKKEAVAEMLSNFHCLFYELIDLSVPTLAKISGFCLGGALELALMCNFIFADQSAKMGQPEIVLGVFPPPASLLLPLKIGYARAEEMLITGENISAGEAKEFGLVNEVFSDRAALNEGVEYFIEKHILPKSASSLRFAVKAARTELNEIIINKLPRLEELYVKELMQTRDANEGIEAFLEKRKPDWKNL